MILNDANAVKTFAQAGSLTLGGNVSIAAGPIGRNAEASGAASIRSVAAIFSYSKTKGLFAGVSLEGSVIVERKDANAKFYGGQVSARQLLSGTIQPPPDAGDLMRILNSRVFQGPGGSRAAAYDDLYDNDAPVYGDDYTRGVRSYATGDSAARTTSPPGGRTRAQTWTNDDPQYWERHRADPAKSFDAMEQSRSSRFQQRHFESTYSDDPGPQRSPTTSKPGPGRPAAPKPVFRPAVRASDLKANQAVALYTFAATQEGDLGVFCRWAGGRDGGEHG